MLLFYVNSELKSFLNREFEIRVYRELLTAVSGYPFAVRRSNIIRFRLAVD